MKLPIPPYQAEWRLVAECKGLVIGSRLTGNNRALNRGPVTRRSVVKGKTESIDLDNDSATTDRAKVGAASLPAEIVSRDKIYKRPRKIIFPRSHIRNESPRRVPGRGGEDDAL